MGQPRPNSFSASLGGCAPLLAQQHMAPCPRTCQRVPPHPRLRRAGRHCRAHSPLARDVHLCSRRTAAQSPRCSPASQVSEHHCAPHPQSHAPAAPLRIPKTACSPRGIDCERGFVVAVQGSKEGPTPQEHIYAIHTPRPFPQAATRTPPLRTPWHRILRSGNPPAPSEGFPTHPAALKRRQEPRREPGWPKARRL